MRNFHIFTVHKLLNHIVKFHRIPQSQCIQEKIADTAGRTQNNHTFIITFRPASRFHIVLTFIKCRIRRQLIENVRTHHGGHQTAGTGRRTEAQRVKRTVRIYLMNVIPILSVDLRRHIVTVFYGIRISLNSTLFTFKIFFQRLQVVGVHRGKHICNHLNNIDFILRRSFFLISGCPHIRYHQRTEIKTGI